MVEAIKIILERHLLSAVIFTPLLGVLWLYFIPGGSERQKLYRGITFLWSLLVFILSLLVLIRFKPSNTGFQLVENSIWIDAFNVRYAVGVDGISIFLVLLTTFLMPIVILASHSVSKSLRGYLANMLLLESAMLGTFLAMDLFLFYLFWELMLFPMYFLIGIWGGPRRIYATLKFVLYTVFGSVLMLVAIFYVVYVHYKEFGEVSFLISDLLQTVFRYRTECILFLAFGIAFAIKVPIFPFHTWLPDAHVEAPTGGSVVLAGVLLKMGLYGFIRFGFPLFPRASEYFTPLLAVLAVVGIIYGALVAWAQSDIKKLVAYSSVSHLGYCVLGFVALNSISTTGSIVQMLNHGISTGALFLLVGVLYDRRHTREIKEYGGLASRLPIYAFFFLVFTLSSIALPLTNGFVGEFLILMGSFSTMPVYVAFAVLGVILGAIYMLTLYLKVMFGKIDEKKNGALSDVTRGEIATFVPLLFMVFYIGIYPQWIISVIKPSVDHYVSWMEERRSILVMPKYAGKSGEKKAFSVSFERGTGESGADVVDALSIKGM
ncbi:MAG: NADH-quinone oxidoreductase subunit M [Candidatus Dadabacteria bacterium]|nr:MAG: NADH-quinone oxidoreductase subunit M [Candidatus Dadabacteria bacterium]